MKFCVVLDKILFLIILWSPQFHCQNTLHLHSTNGEIVNHTYYSLSYSETHEQAEWVTYSLNPNFLNGSASRTDDFKEDPLVSTQSASNSDYLYSGYDRGHLVPAADMAFSDKSMLESFYYSNISPQNSLFNRGGWKKLESQVRNWGKSFDIIVVTGGVLNDSLKTIGINRVSIPNQFYKIVYAPSKNEMIGFLMPNKKIYDDIVDYITTVDEIENITGIDFFINLEDEIEELLESKIDSEKWEFNVDTSPSNSKSSSSSATQCTAIAKSTGQRCRNRTKNLNELCSVHQEKPTDVKTNYIGRCNATTKKGTRCKRKATGVRRYCWQH
jgi:endonuclease G, mitochondrial